VGIHSGVATIGNVGSLTRRDFTALGDTINLCHRLLENSTAGQIIISEDTRRYMHQADAGALAGIRLEERPPVLGKGKTHPTQVYEVFRS
jgi:adenylate cyclase